MKGEPLYQRHGFVHHHAEQVQVIPEGTAVTSSSRYSSGSQSVDHNQNRGDRMKLHHPRHTNRHNMYYAPEDREQNRGDRMKLHHPRHTNRHNMYYAPEDREGHYEQRNEQTSSKYGEYGRPGSRSGITESVPFTHYVNYNELQNHLSRKEQLSDSQIVQMRLQVQQQRLKVEEESRKQHQYHSQRQPRQDNQLRPVSNYYEYETVQSVLNSRGVRPGIQPPIQPPPYQDPNSNSLTRQQVQGRSSASRSHHTQHRGPFVTHVTIGDHSQQNGTKV
ncbi:hypothetical protein QE152_g8855 [Popillia japonica]|uniref:Uncharacterized protein n=1 Tax=Popillia japonica TaxID=7064 RepID=A0AAW1M0E3_POPJA